MQHPGIFPQHFFIRPQACHPFLQDFHGILITWPIGGVAFFPQVDDNRQVQFGSQVELFAEDVLLVFAGGSFPVVIQADFADGDDLALTPDPSPRGGGESLPLPPGEGLRVRANLV